MVRFNELRITEDRKCLIVDCEVEQIGLYSDMYIDEIRLDYYKNVDSSGIPTTKSYQMWKYQDGDPKMRGVRVSMDDTALSDTEFGIDTFKDELFYVTVICGGDFANNMTVHGSELPCGVDNNVDIQAVIDWKGFYERGMQFVSSMYGCGADKCEIPAGFEDFILLWNALKAAIAVCDWPLVAKLWDRILRSRAYNKTVGISGGCGCGR